MGDDPPPCPVPSRLADVEAGLVALRACIERFGPTCVALPALGCGRGGLDWNRVAPLIGSTLADLDARILVHEPARGGYAGRR